MGLRWALYGNLLQSGMASVLSCSVEWYQSESVVTASLSLKGVSRGETVTPKFSSQHCAIYVGGEGELHVDL